MSSLCFSWLRLSDSFYSVLWLGSWYVHLILSLLCYVVMVCTILSYLWNLLWVWIVSVPLYWILTELSHCHSLEGKWQLRENANSMMTETHYWQIDVEYCDWLWFVIESHDWIWLWALSIVLEWLMIDDDRSQGWWPGSGVWCVWSHYGSTLIPGNQSEVMGSLSHYISSITWKDRELSHYSSSPG